mgnify:CR=1 FL=1
MLLVEMVLAGCILLVTVLIQIFRGNRAARLPVLLMCSGALLLFANWLLFLFGILLLGVVIVCDWGKVRTAGSSLASVFASLVVWFALIQAGFENVRKFEKYRERYPFNSMSPRLSYESRRMSQSPPILSKPARRQLADLERGVEDLMSSNDLRKRALRRIHDRAINQFVRAPGFGQSRLNYMSTYMPPLDDDRDPVLMPDLEKRHLRKENATLVKIGQPIPLSETMTLWSRHRLGYLDFVFPKGYGYARDPDLVAGFLSHRMSASPELATNDDVLETARIELISLLKHSTPRVYLSDHLPNMNQLRDKHIMTRELDWFEAEALRVLQNGKMLHAQANGQEVRMLGAIRAAKQCLQCHGVQRGELLGAFSYRLHRANR